MFQLPHTHRNLKKKKREREKKKHTKVTLLFVHTLPALCARSHPPPYTYSLFEFICRWREGSCHRSDHHDSLAIGGLPQVLEDQGIASLSSQNSSFKIGTLVATVPGSWCCWVSALLVSLVSVYCVWVEIASLICIFCIFYLLYIVHAELSLRYILHVAWLPRWPSG